MTSISQPGYSAYCFKLLGDSLSKLSDAFSIQCTTLNALIIRESRTRYGASSFGYLWAIILPVAWIFTFYCIFLATGRIVPFYEGITPFIASGIITYHAFQKTYDFTAKAIKNNKALLYFHRVQPIDLFFSRAMLDGGTYITIFFIIILSDMMWFSQYSFSNIFYILGGLILSSFLGTGLAICIAAIALTSHSIFNTVSVVLRPLFFISGIFFLPANIPHFALEFLQYNPIMQLIDLVREGLFVSYTSMIFNLSYVLGWIIGLFAIGFILLAAKLKRVSL